MTAAALPLLPGNGEPGAYAAGAGRGSTVRTPFVPDYAGRADRLARIRRLTEHGVLLPRVARTLAPADAPEAHRLLEAGGIRGRLVLTF